MLPEEPIPKEPILKSSGELYQICSCKAVFTESLLGMLNLLISIVAMPILSFSL